MTTPFVERHIGPNSQEIAEMLKTLEFSSLDEFVSKAVPVEIQSKRALDIRPALTEQEALQSLKTVAAENQITRSFIGMGYYGCFVPPVIQRSVFENPGWYTQYTPYQAEISQGRLEALLNFQTMVSDLTGLPVSNASLLDEATAAAEAMTLAFGARKNEMADEFLVSPDIHPQTKAVLETRAAPLGIRLISKELRSWDFSQKKSFGFLVQYPDTRGEVTDFSKLVSDAHKHEVLSVLATDLLALVLLKSPGSIGADIAIGSSQRFGVPLGYGGPHAAFMAVKTEHQRKIPGRLIGASKDAHGNVGYRLALQTREQHIRREKATSNICTAQVLLAVMASMYAVYHGPGGLRKIAIDVAQKTQALADLLRENGLKILNRVFFDTFWVEVSAAAAPQIRTRAQDLKINFREVNATTFGISLDEATTPKEIQTILKIFTGKSDVKISGAVKVSREIEGFFRTDRILTHPTFNKYHSETEMLRYIRRLESKDLSLTTSMISLGSCTMKLNAAAEMFPVSWPEFSNIHPFVPIQQVPGYQKMMKELEKDLCELTGFDAFSLQPNAGSQGEYAGLLVIRAYHQANGQPARNVCLIPKSAHGTNPASAALAGMQVVVVECDRNGNVDLGDLAAKAAAHAKDLAALMITYPSTHGVFEENISKVCQLVHQYGGQVYMDGANMNAQIGVCRPAEFGADVCHLNLHKTFCIPHGGGGPGMGPIGVKKHLEPYLPGHPVIGMGIPGGGGAAVSAAPWGSPSILPISWMYIRMMGAEGLKRATQVAILSANYMAHRLEPHYPVLYRGARGLVAHECIVDLRPLKTQSGIEVEDVAKRLMDYGYHAPTVSFPVPGTMMIEPTESESKEEIDRFCDALILIREEIRLIEAGKSDRANNPLKHAPHTAWVVGASAWDHPYSREVAAFPASWLRQHKFWPSVSRIDSAYGDRNLMCTCPPIESFQ